MPTKDPQEPYHRATVDEAKELIEGGAHVIDVRDPPEYEGGHVPAATGAHDTSVIGPREGGA